MIKNIIRKIVHYAGLDIVRYNITPLDRFFELLRYLKFYPKHIVDIGANRGSWTRRAIKYFPDAEFTLLEPQEWLKENFKDILKKKNVTFHAAGAGDKNGTLKFTIDKNDVSSTFRYAEEVAKSLGFRQIEVPVVRLDTLLAGKTIPDMIKIDAEGYDIEVLEGAGELLGRSEVILVEAGVVYKGLDNSVLKLINYMDNKGYRLFDLTDFNRPPIEKVLWLLEMAFVKKGGTLDSNKFDYK